MATILVAEDVPSWSALIVMLFDESGLEIGPERPFTARAIIMTDIPPPPPKFPIILVLSFAIGGAVLTALGYLALRLW